MNRCISAICCMIAFFTGSAIQGQEPSRKESPKSVTVYPVVITPRENIVESMSERIAEVIGLMLERSGIGDVQLAPTRFAPADEEDASKLSAAFGEFVARNPPTTDYAILGQFLGTPATGVKEIRTVVADPAGKVIFVDVAKEETLRQSKIRPRDPMTASLYLVDRLGTIWTLADPNRADASQGNMADRMRARSGMPSDQEMSEMNRRRQKIKGTFAERTVTIYPIQHWIGREESKAANLVETMNRLHVCRAAVSPEVPKFDFEGQGDPNEQKVLWDTARAFREFLRAHPPTTEFGLLVDYGISPSEDKTEVARYVHLILCDKSGDWVLVDFQNSHHEDFKRVAPTSPDRCHELAALRLKSL